MRLIVILVALLVVALLVKKQLDSSPSTEAYKALIDESGLSTPKVPTSPSEIKQFEDDMNQFMQDAADQKAKGIEEAMNQ